MKLFVVQEENAPDTFFQVDTPEEALKKWKWGLTNPQNHSPTVKEVDSIETLLALAPTEFKLDDDTSF